MDMQQLIAGTPEGALAAAASLSWRGGWSLVLLGFVSGAALGLGFHREGFLGGYDSWRRRLVRLGHIALVALGVLNVLASFTPWTDPELARVSSLALLVGGVAMPTVCFLAAWRRPFRHLFFVPVTCLLTGVVTLLLGGSP